MWCATGIMKVLGGGSDKKGSKISQPPRTSPALGRTRRRQRESAVFAPTLFSPCGGIQSIETSFAVMYYDTVCDTSTTGDAGRHLTMTPGQEHIGSGLCRLDRFCAHRISHDIHSTDSRKKKVWCAIGIMKVLVIDNWQLLR